MAMVAKHNSIEARHSLFLNRIPETIEEYLTPDPDNSGAHAKVGLIPDALQAQEMKLFFIVNRETLLNRHILAWDSVLIMEQYLLPEADITAADQIVREANAARTIAHQMGRVSRDFFESYIPKAIPKGEVCEGEKECSICYQPLGFTLRLACGHVFDAKCLQEWRLTRSNTCPIDRRIIDPSQMTSASAAFTYKKGEGFVEVDFPLHKKVDELKAKIAQDLRVVPHSFVLLDAPHGAKITVLHREKYLYETFHKDEIKQLTVYFPRDLHHPNFRDG